MSSKSNHQKEKKSPNVSKQAKPVSGRLAVIDMMVGMAMVLVVLGHMSVGGEPEWYGRGMHLWIYSFHMELFVFLSAFLIRYSYKGVDSLKSYGAYIWRKFVKLFLWFLIIGMGVSLLACVVKGYPLNGGYLLESLRTLLLYPRWSEAAFLWYIYILFGFYLVSPLLFRLPQWARVLLCVGALLLTMMPGSALLCSHEFCQYTFFYFLGVLCAEWIEEIRSVKIWAWGLLSVPFLVWTVWLLSEGFRIEVQMWQLGWWTTVTGVASIPFFYLLGKALVKIKPLCKALTAVSKSCYWIYLLQMFVIWGVARLLWPAWPFGAFMAVAALLALVLPILLRGLWTVIKKAGHPSGSPAKNTSLK